MRKNLQSFLVFIALIICSVLVLNLLFQIGIILFTLYFNPALKSIYATSIGIIGGADGPTSIYFSHSVNCISVLQILELGGLIYILIVLIIIYKNGKKML